MKGKRYTTEEKIRLLREADRGEKSIQQLCREENGSEVTFHRWKKQFGHMEINEARRLKELERENRELKKMLAESLLKNRVLEAVCEKKLCVRRSAGRWRADREANAVKATAVGLVGRTATLRVSADCRVAAPGRLAGGQGADPTPAACGRITRAPEQTQAGPAWRFHWLAAGGHAPESRVDVGLHRGRNRARWRPPDADHPG